MYLRFNKYLKLDVLVIIIICLVIGNEGQAAIDNKNTHHYNDWNQGLVSSKKKPYKIIIDAGHGGHDPGCKGSNSIEKDISLKIALKTGALIQQSNENIEVIYTRTEDVFVPLHKRIDIANKCNADIFISIHCNASSNKSAQGTESFVMGLHRSEENLEVAKRENQVITMEAGYDKHYGEYDPNSPVGHIILSTFQNLHLDQSISLAKKIEDNFNQNCKQKTRGVKQAGFVVLRNATMLSVLVETGFLTNPDNEKFLSSEKGQTQSAESISKAILNYVRDLKSNEIKDNQEEQIAENRIKQKSDNPPRKTSITNQINKQKKSLKTKDAKKKSTVKIVKNKATYKIQLAATTTPSIDTTAGKWQSLEQVNMVKSGDLYKYYTGTYDNKSMADSEKNKLRKAGFKGAFVVSN